MNTPDYIVDVSEADFEIEVIGYSERMPVVVDFWAEWCGPCKMLGPLLERLAGEAQGSFRLAKVNVDENPNLALQFSVRSIPSVKAFRNGRVVAEFTGAQPEGRVREFIRSLAPSQVDLTLEKGTNLLEQHHWGEAEQAYRQVLEDTPGQPSGLLGLVKSLLAQGYGEDALFLMDGFPPSKEYATIETLQPLASALVKNLDPLAGQAEAVDPLDAAYMQALRLVGRGNIPAAIDGILDILRQDKRYGGGEARKVLLALFELLGNQNELTRQYRNELALILF